MNGKDMVFRVSQTRDYGAFTQTYSIEVVVNVASAQDKQLQFEKLNRGIAEEFASFEHNHMPNHQPDRNDVHGKWYGGTLIKIIAGGKTQYKLKTGDYTKWGVPVYPEILPQFPAVEEGWQELDLTGYEGELKMNGDNPVKVLSCRSSQ